MATWSALVSFHIPSDDGGMPITQYTVTSIPDGITATGTSSPIIVSGLTEGVKYAFTVHATNSNGNGLESAQSNAVPLLQDTITIKPLSLTSSSLIDGTYYTTTLYPIPIFDSLSVGGLSVSFGHTFEQMNPVVDTFKVSPLAISGGSLASSIVYKTYNDTDALKISPLAISSGSLATTIAYVTYNDTDALKISPLAISSGSLATTIAYVPYTWPKESITINSLSIKSGSLV